jgi:hypothetical protein
MSAGLNAGNLTQHFSDLCTPPQWAHTLLANLTKASINSGVSLGSSQGAPALVMAVLAGENEIWPLWTVSGHYVLEYPYDMIWPL